MAIDESLHHRTGRGYRAADSTASQERATRDNVPVME
jgi:hypothetical protein